MHLRDLDYLAKWNILLKFIIFFCFLIEATQKHKILYITGMFSFSGTTIFAVITTY